MGGWGGRRGVSRLRAGRTPWGSGLGGGCGTRAGSRSATPTRAAATVGGEGGGESPVGPRVPFW